MALCRMSVAYDDLGNDRQEGAIREHAERRGYEIVAVKKDVMSATKFRLNDRPGWVEAIGMVLAGLADAVAIYHLDRLTRDNRDLEDVIDTGVAVLCASGEIDLSTDMGRTLARILTAIAKGEVERKSARQKLANLQRFELGLPFVGGPRAFGYTQDGMTIIEEEAEAFRWAVQAAMSGTALRAIARGLSTAGFPSARAKHSRSSYSWTHGGVRNMLLNPRYIALRNFNGGQVKGIWPALIEEETHQALKRVLGAPGRDPSPGWSKNKTKPVNLLSLVARCGVCGCPLIAGARRGEPRYTCRSKKGCVYTPRAAADTAVTEAVLGLLCAPGFAETLVPADDDRAAAAQAELDRLHARLKTVREDHLNGDYDEDPEGYRQATTELRAKIKVQKAVLDELAELAIFDGLDLGTDAVIEQWDTLAFVAQRAIVAKLLDVRVLPVGMGRNSFDPTRHVVIKRKRALTAV